MVGLQRMLHHLLRIVWAALLLACMDGSTAGGSGAGGGGASGGAAEDSALAATNLLCMAVQRKRADLAAMLAGEAAAPGAPPLPESWRSPLRFRAKCEEHLAGFFPARPGILYLLRVLAGAERWLDGSRREASWELQRCAAAAATEVAALLTEARQAASEWQAPVDQQAVEPAAAPQGEPAAAGEAAGAAQAPAIAQPAAGGEAAAAAEDREQGSPAADAAARKKEAAKARQQQMLARMRAQQAKAAAALLEESSDEEAEGAAVAAAEGPTAMAVDAGGEAAAAVGAAAQRPALPAHHPAAWEAHAGAECALCKSGSDTAPLGFVAQLQVTLLPTLAAADPATPLTPEHPGVCGGAVGAATEGGEAPPAFPLGGAGPRLSVFDRQPSLHLLCCGHMLHASCLDSYRWAFFGLWMAACLWWSVRLQKSPQRCPMNWHEAPEFNSEATSVSCCLFCCRASWRQRIAQGQFVEGFQLLQASPAAGVHAGAVWHLQLPTWVHQAAAVTHHPAAWLQLPLLLG